jgi:hypothetical protein
MVQPAAWGHQDLEHAVVGGQAERLRRLLVPLLQALEDIAPLATQPCRLERRTEGDAAGVCQDR